MMRDPAKAGPSSSQISFKRFKVYPRLALLWSAASSPARSRACPPTARIVRVHVGHTDLGQKSDSSKFGKTTIASMEIYDQPQEEQYTSPTEAASIYLRVGQPFI